MLWSCTERAVTTKFDHRNFRACAQVQQLYEKELC
jgi:hypothetical protein